MLICFTEAALRSFQPTTGLYSRMQSADLLDASAGKI
jgi:hypothetical protein